MIEFVNFLLSRRGTAEATWFYVSVQDGQRRRVIPLQLDHRCLQREQQIRQNRVRLANRTPTQNGIVDESPTIRE
jgi:hypothetical protein